MLVRPLFASALALLAAACASAQTPGPWRFTIATDRSNIRVAKVKHHANAMQCNCGNFLLLFVRCFAGS